MNLDAVGNIAELVSAIAVVLSIPYLARQVRQGSLLALAENQRELLDSAPIWHPLATTPGLISDVRDALSRYEEIDPDGQARFTFFFWPFFNHVESAFRAYRQGFIEEDSYERWMAGAIGVILTPGGSQG